MFGKLKMAVAAASVAGVMALGGAATASATDFDITNGGSFTSLDAGASRLVVHGPNGSIPVDCNASRGIADIVADTYAFGDVVGQITPLFGAAADPVSGSCTGPGGLTFTVSCAPADLRVTGVPGATSDADGTLTGIDCTITFDLLGCDISVTGDVSGEYFNPTTPALDNGRLVILAAGQNLTVVSDAVCSSFVPSGTGTFGSPGAGSTGVGDLEYELDPAHAPHPVIS